MTLRVQRTFQVADVRVLFGVHLVVGENEFHRIDEEPHLSLKRIYERGMGNVVLGSEREEGWRRSKSWEAGGEK